MVMKGLGRKDIHHSSSCSFVKWPLRNTQRQFQNIFIGICWEEQAEAVRAFKWGRDGINSNSLWVQKLRRVIIEIMAKVSPLPQPPIFAVWPPEKVILLNGNLIYPPTRAQNQLSQFTEEHNQIAERGYKHFLQRLSRLPLTVDQLKWAS